MNSTFSARIRYFFIISSVLLPKLNTAKTQWDQSEKFILLGFVASKHTLSNPCVARILLPACHRTNIFQIIPGISYFCTNNEVENRFFPGALAIFSLILAIFFIIYFKPMVVGRQTRNRIWNPNPNIWSNKMVTSWTVFHKGVKESNFPTFTYHIHHYGNVLHGFSNLRVWGKKRDFYSETQPTAAMHTS